jgi:hypothetical protein
MPGIDDPLEAVDKQYRDGRDYIFDKLWRAAAELGPYGILNALKVLFSRETTAARFEAFIQELRNQVYRLEAQGRLLKERVESPEFQETLIAAMNETARTTDRERTKRFALIVSGSLDKSRTMKSWDDAAAYIRDLAQLGERDIQALEILYAVQKDLFLGKSHPLDPNTYTAKNNDVLELAYQSSMPPDEFYSRCARLNGFGLAIEVQRNDTRVSPGDHCFRLTTRGRELISILSA